MTTSRSCSLASLVALALATACGADSLEPISADRVSADVSPYSDWSAPVNLGTPVNSAGFVETNPWISKDGLSLYFACGNCPGGFGGLDIWVAQRTSSDAGWGSPQNVGPTINSAFNDHVPTLSKDGHRLYFASDRPGFGANDLYVSRRHTKRDDFSWQPPENLGSPVNTSANETVAAPFEDDETGTVSLYFVSNREGGLGDDDIYVTTVLPDGTFGPAVLSELSSPFRDTGPAISRDGLEMFFASTRSLVVGAIDLWSSTRGSTSDPWSTPVNLGPIVNSTVMDARPSLSFDGTTLYFQSTRPGGLGFFDIWVTTRSKLEQLD